MANITWSKNDIRIGFRHVARVPGDLGPGVNVYIDEIINHPKNADSSWDQDYVNRDGKHIDWDDPHYPKFVVHGAIGGRDGERITKEVESLDAAKAIAEPRITKWTSEFRSAEPKDYVGHVHSSELPNYVPGAGRNALGNYVVSDDTWRFRAVFLGGDAIKENYLTDNDVLKTKFQIHEIKGLMKEQPIDYPLYRGMVISHVPEVGEEFTADSFQSTSLSRDVAADFYSVWGGGGNHTALIEFHDRTPRGAVSLATYPGEDMVLLDEGTEYKITKVERNVPFKRGDGSTAYAEFGGYGKAPDYYITAEITGHDPTTEGKPWAENLDQALEWAKNQDAYAKYGTSGQTPEWWDKHNTSHAEYMQGEGLKSESDLEALRSAAREYMDANTRTQATPARKIPMAESMQAGAPNPGRGGRGSLNMRP